MHHTTVIEALRNIGVHAVREGYAKGRFTLDDIRLAVWALEGLGLPYMQMLRVNLLRDLMQELEHSSSLGRFRRWRTGDYESATNTNLGAPGPGEILDILEG